MIKTGIENCTKDVTVKWSQSAVGYFNVYIKSHIINHVAKWVVQQFPCLFNPFSGITNKKELKEQKLKEK